MSDRTTPRVSIGLPVYNGQRYAIECLLGQSFTDFELIVADNASTDSTPCRWRSRSAAARSTS